MEAISAVLASPDYFILVLLRMAGLVIPSPIFGRTTVPQMAKIGLAVALGYLAFATYPAVAPIAYDNLLAFLFVCAGELLIGIGLAYVTNLFFNLPFTGGQLIDMQIGFGIVNVYDPQNNTQVPMTGNLMNLILLIVFWGVDGHHKVIEILFATLRALPVGNVLMGPAVGMGALGIFARTFALGVMVALPVIASGLVVEFCFGALMRTVPQLNMFVVGIPVKLLLGLLILLITMPAFVGFSNTVFGEMYTGIDTFFGSFYAG
jgi:flagellar biosynthetic protein FliR